MSVLAASIEEVGKEVQLAQQLAQLGPADHAAVQSPVVVDLPLRELRGVATSHGTSVDDLLDAFLAEHATEDIAAPEERWGEKVGFSVYDEEEVLGRLVTREDVLQELYELYEYLAEEIDGEDGDNDDEEDPEDEEGDDDNDDDDEGDIDEGLSPRICPYALKDGELPRVARAIRPLCCVDRLKDALPEECPICLDAFEPGQEVWRLPCNHVVHDACMVRYLSSRRGRAQCPICRCDIKAVAAASLTGF